MTERRDVVDDVIAGTPAPGSAEAVLGVDEHVSRVGELTKTEDWAWTLLPTLGEPRKDADRDEDAAERQEKEARRKLDKSTIAAAVSFVVLFLGTVLAVRYGLFQGQGESQGVPWDVTLVVIAYLITAVMAFQAVKAFPLKEGGGGLGSGRRDPRKVLVFAGVTTGVLGGIALNTVGVAIHLGWWTSLGPFALPPDAPLILASLALITAFAPFGYLEHKRIRQVRRMEERFPDFLRDLTETHRQSQTFAQAIKSVSRSEYGALTPEVQKMAHQVSWGLPFSEVLTRFSHRVHTPLIERTVSLIVKATQAGGDRTSVLEAAEKDAREIKLLEHERRVTMTTYVIVVYVAFFVFLAVVAILKTLFVPAMLGATQGTQGSLAGISISTITITEFDFIYYCAGFVQALGSGIVVGVLSEGTFAAGLKHASILVACSVLVLGILL